MDAISEVGAGVEAEAGAKVDPCEVDADAPRGGVDGPGDLEGSPKSWSWELLFEVSHKSIELREGSVFELVA